MPKKSQPLEKQQLLTFSAYGRRIGVSQQRISAIVKAGQISKAALVTSGRRQLIDPVVADADLRATLDPARVRASVPDDKKRHVIAAAGFDPDNPDYQRAKAFHETYKAALKKIELEKARGEVVSRQIFGDMSFNFARQVRDAFQNLPARLCDQLSTMTDRFEIQTLLDDEIRQILLAVSDAGIGRHVETVVERSKKNG